MAEKGSIPNVEECKRTSLASDDESSIASTKEPTGSKMADQLDFDTEKQPFDGVRDNSNAIGKAHSNQEPLHSVFTSRQKLFIVTMTALASFFSPLSGQIYFPAIPQLADDYHTSTGKINLTITTYMILQGLAPTIMGTFGDTTGRRPAYVVAFTIYLAANIGLATQKSYLALLILRALQSAGSSGTIALGYGVIADVCTPAERGKYLGPVAAGIMTAPAIGPTIGGLLARFLGWRSIFWFLAIICGVYITAYMIFVPETARKVVGNGSIVPTDWWVMSPVQAFHARKELKRTVVEGRKEELDEKRNKAVELAKKRKFKFPNPLNSVLILRNKDAAIIISFIAIGMTALLDMLASMPILFGEVYGFDSLKVGFCYMPVGAAAALAAFSNGKIMDWNYRRWAKKLNFALEKKRGTDLRHFPIEKVRLQPLFIIVPIGVASYIPFGWILQYRVHLAVPLALQFVTGFCMVAMNNTLSSLLVDLFPEKPATASAAANLCFIAEANLCQHKDCRVSLAIQAFVHARSHIFTMSKRSHFTTITPLPAGVTRASVLDTLRNHFEMIDLNPLVIERKRQDKAPPFAGPEEYHATWYQITDNIKGLPGTTTYHGCFHDLADGLQTHVYAPAGLDIRGKWQLGGTLPGEPTQTVELGLNPT
ncbi:hypothetical protein EG327_000266 [Venturia inaequalis]|uniref:Major facilitator superfamily (MFS) profile domain-containing protein n=2 Tax=Venturia inaequalis TaxID=5025 RepID=A0A8H3ZGI3_VENIN|nr:hypothetical protein EG327_000266 [Venturia inaequalis]